MKDLNQSAIAKRYSDLLTNQEDDTSITQIITTLDSIYTAPQRPASVSWSILKTRYNQMQMSEERQSTRTLPATLFRPARQVSLRMGIFLSILLLALLTMGTVYAQISGVLDDVIKFDPGTSQLQQQNQLTNTDMSQTIQGFTFKIQKVYADSNRIVFTYTIQSPANLKKLTALFPFEDTMSYQQSGDHYQQLVQLGGQGTYDPNPTAATIVSFSTSSIQGNPTALHLKYVLKGIEYAQFENQAPVIHTIKEQLTFTFSVPFHVGMEYTIGQKQTSQDGTLMLDKVLVSQSAVQVFMHKANWTSGPKSSNLTLSLSPTKIISGVSHITIGNDPQPYYASMGINNANSLACLNHQDCTGHMDDEFSLLIPYSLASKPGNWTLHLLFSSQEHPGQINYTMLFHFTIPIAQ